MSDDREKNATIIRDVVAQADTDGLDRFMAQYCKATVAEWLIAQMPVVSRVAFLKHQLAVYASELAAGPSA